MGGISEYQYIRMLFVHGTFLLCRYAFRVWECYWCVVILLVCGNTYGVWVHSLCVGHVWCVCMLLECYIPLVCGNTIGVSECFLCMAYFWCVDML